MSKSYTNKNDVLITVSSEHLDVAIELYEELSKTSPSGRVNWTKHKKLMMEEGFNDSDNSERYRQLIKQERSRRGLLPSVKKHAELVSEGVLKSIRNEVGEMKLAKQEAQDHFTKLNRLKRETSRELLMYEAIERAIERVGIGDNSFNNFNPIPDSDGVMLVTLNDIHYGYDVDAYITPVETGDVLNQYADKLITIINKESISRVIVANEGDSIEGRLRRQSIADAGTSSVDQMIEVTDLIISFINKLSDYCYVDYIAIAGNHDRIAESFRDALDGESFVPINTKLTERYFRDNDRVAVLQTDSVYHHIINIKGNNVFLAHGDRHSIKSDSLLAELSLNHDVNLDLVVVGHFHNFRVSEVGNNKYQVITGSIKGPDSYSEKINKQSCRSQVAIIFKGKDFDIRQVKL